MAKLIGQMNKTELIAKAKTYSIDVDETWKVPDLKAAIMQYEKDNNILSKDANTQLNTDATITQEQVQKTNTKPNKQFLGYDGKHIVNVETKEEALTEVQLAQLKEKGIKAIK